MSTYREVSCYVNNQTGEALTVTTFNVIHGEYSKGGVEPPDQVSADFNSQLFYLHKNSGGTEGIQAVCEITLPDGSILNISVCNPDTQEYYAGDGNTGSCWFYAMITNTLQAGATSYAATVEAACMDPDDTNTGDCTTYSGTKTGFQAYPETNGNLLCGIVTIYSIANGVPDVTPVDTSSTDTDVVQVTVNFINNSSAGVITLQGLANGVNASPCGDNTCAPVVQTLINNDGDTHTAVSAATLIQEIMTVGGEFVYSTSSFGASFNLPNGDTLGMTSSFSTGDPGSGTVSFQLPDDDTFAFEGENSPVYSNNNNTITYTITIGDNS